MTDACPRHPENTLWPTDGPVHRCLANGCHFQVRGPAPEPTWPDDWRDMQ